MRYIYERGDIVCKKVANDKQLKILRSYYHW